MLASQFDTRDMSLMSALVDAYARNGKLAKAYDTLEEMKRLGLQLHPSTFVSLAQGYAKKGNVTMVQKLLLTDMVRHGLQMNVQTWTVLADAHSRSKHPKSVLRVMQEAERCGQVDERLYYVVVRGLLRIGDVVEAEHVIQRMTSRGLHRSLEWHVLLVREMVRLGQSKRAWRAFLQGLVLTRQPSNAWSPHEQQLQRIHLGNALLSALVQSKDLVTVEETYTAMKKEGFCADAHTTLILMDGYARCDKWHKVLLHWSRWTPTLTTTPSPHCYQAKVDALAVLALTHEGKQKEASVLAQQLSQDTLTLTNKKYT
jgi:pentatricopeptide repeat protein